ncbi:MAG TPA: DNA polymerase/3'-5' exonuclease PolX, partial [Solirubrobacterales bacterium]|nr:DNA polymerase/3'-5' exonuclease PolX [Solirubrobacterales bacterium]
MTNAEIAAALEELGVLYELDGAVKYRVLAYSTAAKAIRESPVSVAELAAAGRATEIPGVGKTLAEKIDALLETGEIPAAVKLKARFPPTLIEVTRVPGVGAKTAKLLFDELGVTSLEDLKVAAEAEKVRDVKGLGPKAEENVLASLERLGEPGEGPGRVLLSTARPIAEELAAALREHPAAERVEVAGSARRWAETCKDIDLIATAEQPAALAEHLAGHELIAAAGKPGANGVRAQTHNGISVDLRIVAPEAFGNLLQHFTGSQAHNVQLREEAVARGLSVSEHGITETESGEKMLCESEEEVYERLGYAYIEPELREGRGELKVAHEGKLPDLILVEDVRGDLHSHTTLSDGRNTLEEMAAAGRERGYAYMAITDHSASHGFGDHVTAERLWERIEEVREWNEGVRGFRLLAGSEVNIGLDGGLDYPDDLLEALDWVVASVHTSFSISAAAMTERVLTAIENPHVDCIGHLTGRLIGRREPYGVDVEAVVEAAANAGTMLEINGNPNRRDLSEHHARLARDAGVA